MKSNHQPILYGILITITLLTMLPFFFVVNNSFRTNNELYHSYFGMPSALLDMTKFTWFKITGQQDKIICRISDDTTSNDTDVSQHRHKTNEYSQAMGTLWRQLTKGYAYSWTMLKPYMFNTIFVCLMTAFGVVLIGSVTAYIFSRHKFPGKHLLFMILLSMMMVPAVLTLVPSFLLVKKLHLLNSYWVLILPYVSGGQIIAIFLFKGFFDGLPEELFESARIDGAGHLTLYLQIVLPLSKQIMAVVLIMTVLGTWNNFLWPFIANSDSRYHVIASGLYLMSQTQVAENFSTMFASYVLSSIPLLILFIYGAKHFITGITSGAFKA